MRPPPFWKDGRCLELKADPAGKTVDIGSETAIKVTIHHKAYDEEVERPVKATLAGPEKVDPLDAPVMAPAEFNYTATSEPQGEGIITFRSVSNRGIAELSETYKVEARLLLDVDGRVTYTQGPVSGRGTLKGRGLVVRLVSGEVPGVTMSGDLQVRIRVRSPGCSGGLTRAYPVDSGTNASAKLVGEGDERQLSVLLRPADPSATVNVRVQCDGRSASFPLPLGILFPSFRPVASW